MARAAPRPTAPRGVFAHALLLAWMQTRIVWSYAWLWVRTRVFRSASPESVAATHRLNARRFKETASHLKGANVKVGQIASMQTHLLPKETLEELRSLRDAVTPTPTPQIVALIEAELGAPLSTLFATFDEKPMATASMGQVHGATLADGQRVVVKVLHPGLERTVEIDLAFMKLLFRFLSWFLPKKIDLMLVMREAEAPLLRELDLAHEGEATDALGDELRPIGVVVPRVHWDRTSRRVLTLEHIAGVTISARAQLDAWSVNRSELMRVYLQAFIQQALRGGYFHADPHPGNVLCTPEGKLALLDFGMVQRLPDDVRLGLFKEIFGGFFARPKLWADGLIQKGAFGDKDRAKLEAFGETAFRDPKARAMIFDHQVDSHGEMRAMVGEFATFFQSLETMATPRDNVMFMRALGIVIDVMKEVAPEESPSAIATPVMLPVLMEFVGKYPEFADLLGGPPPS